MTHSTVLFKVKQDIARKHVISAMFSPPYSSFSSAQDRTFAWRTKEYPLGVPGLSGQDAEKVRAANECFNSAFKIIRCLERHCVPWSLEHPADSKCWLLPSFAELRKLPHVRTILSDCCQYGAPWRKRTLFLTSRIDELDSGRLHRLCCGSSGPSGLCSRTQARHRRLSGRSKFGRRMTDEAQYFPSRLCHALAAALVAPREVIPA